MVRTCSVADISSDLTRFDPGDVLGDLELFDAGDSVGDLERFELIYFFILFCVGTFD
jgi:hypothetical protein